MAKKKTTENIKAAPVLRAQGGDQPTPTPEQTGTRTYQIMDPWKDLDKVNLVDVNSVDGEITDVKVNGEPAGGGGGLAEVTIINSTANEVNVNMIYVDTDQPPIIGNRYAQGVYVDGSSNRTVQAPTAGDFNKAQGMDGVTITEVTGDIELNSTTHIAIIRGNGTITVS